MMSGLDHLLETDVIQIKKDMELFHAFNTFK